MKYLKHRETEFKKLIKKDPTKEFELRSRRLGRSTGFALQAIGKALSNPNQSIPLADHLNSVIAVRDIQIHLISEIIVKLGLDGLVLDKRRLTLTYKVLFI